MLLFDETLFSQKFNGAYIVLDTSAFIKLSVKNKDYIRIFELFSSFITPPSFLTLDLVKYEFIRGPEKESKLNNYEKLIAELDPLLLLTPQLYNEYEKTVRLFGASGSKVSVTDLFLASVLVKYRKVDNIYLFTENFLEFPHNFFIPEFIFNTYDKKNIKSLVFYKIDAKAVNKRLKQ